MNHSNRAILFGRGGPRDRGRDRRGVRRPDGARRERRRLRRAYRRRRTPPCSSSIRVTSSTSARRPTLVDALRARGYPAPATLARGAVDGSAYELQERMPGAPTEQLTAAMLPNVLALNALQRDVGVDRARSVDRRDGQHHSRRPRRLLRTRRDGRALGRDAGRSSSGCLRIADGARGLRVPDTDVVHYDFSPYNVLDRGRPDHGRRRLERRDER